MRAADLRRELRHLADTTNEQHIRPQLGYKTTAQYRRGKRLHKLPAKFVIDIDHLPISAGKVIFIRAVSPNGMIDVLEQDFKVGKRLQNQYVKAVLETQRQVLKVYLNGRLIKAFVYKLRKE